MHAHIILLILLQQHEGLDQAEYHTWMNYDFFVLPENELYSY